MADEIKYIRSYMNQKLEWLHSLPENACRAELAELRRGVGHIPGDIPALWGTFLTGLPEELYGRSGNISYAEWAVYIALTMFALHQQGHDFKTEWLHAQYRQSEQDSKAANDKREYHLGRAIRKLAKDDDELERVLKRFKILATSSDIRELSNHLRGVVHLLNGNDIKLDYVELACDLYKYALFPESRAGVRLSWGQDFWYSNNNEEKGRE